MTREELLSRIAGRGVPEADAERVVQGVLGALGTALDRSTAEALRDELPSPLGASLVGDTHGEDLSAPELHLRVARDTGAPVGVAVEYVAVVLRAVGGSVRDDVLALVRRELPAPLAPLLAPPGSAPAPPPHLQPGRRTLAEGRPGGGRPLYDARPDRAHTHSVASSDNPHHDTKLSSAAGLTQEREHQTLSSGRPGAARPLSEAGAGPAPARGGGKSPVE